MQIVVNRIALLDALKVVAPGVSSKSTLSILACVKLETVGEGVVSLAATNLDLSMYTELPASVDDSGAAVVDHALLNAVVSEMRAETVTLLVDDAKPDRITVQSEEGTVRLRGSAPDEFAAMPVVLTSQTETVVVDPEWFKRAVNSVAFAAADDDSRPTLTGVYLVGGELVTLAATNGFMLAQWQEGTAVPWPDVKANLSARFLKDVLRVMSPTSITFNCELVVFESAGVRAVLRTLDGSYPNYTEIIKQPEAAVLHAKKSELSVACGLALVIATGKYAAAKMTYEQSGTLVFEASFTERGENASVCSATLDGDVQVTAVALSVQLANDIVTHAPGQEVIVRAPNSGMEPIHFLCADEPAWLAVQMPMISRC